MRKVQLAGGAIAMTILLGGCGSKSAAVDTPVPQADADRKNPTALDAASIQQGKDLYHAADCALFHGKEGDGKGMLAKDTRMNVHDWHDDAYGKTFTDGQLYFLMAKGKGTMPAYETRNTPEQLWLIVDYIRSFSMK